MSMLEALQDPQTRHAALVHLPIALSVVVLLLALVSAVLRGRNATLRWTTVTACALLVLTALITVRSGEAADAELKQLLPEEVFELVDAHKARAEKVWIFGTVTGVLVALSVIRGRTALVASCLAVAGGAATAGWLALTAHDGGTMVYRYGVGTPNPITFQDLQPQPVTDAETETGMETEVVVAGDARLAHFRERIWPILETNCIRCHNPVRARRSGRLDQTSIAGLLTGGRSGPAVVPGRPEESWLLTAMRHEEDLIMPPDKDQLPPEAITEVEQWIIDGAAWDDSVIPARPPADESTTP